MPADVPNYLIQNEIPNGNERVIMNITGVMLDLLVEMDPEFYGKYFVYENGRKVLYVEVLRALYGIMVHLYCVVTSSVVI